MPAFLPCTWKQLFGISCPFCGLQRSVWYLIHGDIWQSIVMLPFLLPGVLTLALLVYAWIGKKPKLLKWTAIILVAMLVGNCIYQNIWNQ